MLKASKILTALTPQKRGELDYEWQQELVYWQKIFDQYAVDGEVFLKVPFNEKDEAKRLGAKWMGGPWRVRSAEALMNCWKWVDKNKKKEVKPEQAPYVDPVFHGSHPCYTGSGDSYEFVILCDKKRIAEGCTKRESWDFARKYMAENPSAIIEIWWSWETAHGDWGGGEPVWTNNPEGLTPVERTSKVPTYIKEMRLKDEEGGVKTGSVNLPLTWELGLSE